MSLPNPITPGRYTTRDGRKAVVRHVETEFGVPFPCVGYDQSEGAWCDATWENNGRYDDGDETDLDLVIAGWPVEFVPGKWYADRDGKPYKFVGNSGIGMRPLVFMLRCSDQRNWMPVERMASGSSCSRTDSTDIIAECAPPEGMT